MSYKSDSSKNVDVIEKIVYDHIKSLGFKKHGRTLHRFVDGDISQLINFQNGCPQKGILDVLWVNIGIRVPECYERKFVITKPTKKYYHEYECNLRSNLGDITESKDNFYELSTDPEGLGLKILEQIKLHILPFFEALDTREAILEKRKDYSKFDLFNNRLIVLEEAMIYGRKGDIVTASKLFNEYYQEVLKEYNHKLEFGSEKYLDKGKSITYFNQRTKQTETVTATENGYVRLFNANRGHLTYLETLANELGLAIQAT